MKIETPNPIKILIYGEERIDFIQNIITNDILNESKSLYSYILTPQGKILFEIKIILMNDCLEIICSNDQSDLLSYLEKYAKLSDISLQKFQLDKANFGESYFLDSLKMGKIDTNFLPHSTLNPSEVHDEYINYQKGCLLKMCLEYHKGSTVILCKMTVLVETKLSTFLHEEVSLARLDLDWLLYHLHQFYMVCIKGSIISKF